MTAASVGPLMNCGDTQESCMPDPATLPVVVMPPSGVLVIAPFDGPGLLVLTPEKAPAWGPSTLEVANP